MARFTDKVAVRDSFIDEDVSDDVDDEVFIRDGRNGFKIDEERGVKRPLMPPRRRLKTNQFHSSSYPHPRMRCRSFLAPCCYGFSALAALLGLIALTVMVLKFVPPVTLDQIRFWKSRTFQQTSKKSTIPCIDFSVHDVWTKSFPKLTSETAVRLSDVNEDNVLDVIIGYGTGADGKNVPDFVCSLFFKRDPPCLGGIVALDGRNGEVLWQHWTQRPVFTIDCAADLTQDNIHDCLVGGKGGLLHAVNGHDGSLLWHLEDTMQQQVEPLLDIYSAQYIADIDGDNFVDIVAAHTSSDASGTAVRGHLLLVSGKAGRLLRKIEMPGASESYFAPQLLVYPDGEKRVLIGTGGTGGHSQGGIHTIPLSVLATSTELLSSHAVMSDFSGLLAPPVLVDINHDGIEDIVASLFNSTVVAVDGRTFLPLWNYSFSNSQSLSSPTPGYFNGDDVPDFLVKYQYGPGLPLYYYSQTNILDGKTGLPLLDHHIVDSVGSQMGGLSIGVEGVGNDWFLYWTANCVGFEGVQTPFSFAKGSSLVAQSQADLCRLRFNSSMSTTLWAINQHINPPGVALYSSEWREGLEFNSSQSSQSEAYEYLASHPDFWSTYVPQIKSGSFDETFKSGSISQDGAASWSKSSPDLTSAQFPLSYGVSISNDPRNPSTGNSGESLERLRLSAGRVKGRNRVGEGEELEEPEYPNMPLHQVGKNRRPAAWTKDRRNWDMDDLRPESSDSVNRDYDLRASDIGDDPRLTNDYSGFLVNLRKSNSDARESASDFLQAIHDEAIQDNQPKHSFLDKNSEDSFSGTKSDLRKTRELKSASFNNQNKVNRDETLNETSNKTSRGIYPITSTGTLAPPLSGSGIDLLLVTYWIPPSEGVQVLFPNDVQCIHDGIARASIDGSGKFSGMDEESVELAVTAECLLYRYSSSASLVEPHYLEPYPGFVPQFFGGSSFGSYIYNNLDLRLGQLTVYRLNLQCRCGSVKSQSETCAKILPFEKQSWPSFMGHDGKGYFHSRF